MEPLLMILIPGLLGGLLLAWLLSRVRRRTPAVVVPQHLSAPSPALINMAHIRVEGVGGLGMVAAVLVVAAADPRIRLVTVLAALVGAGLAAVLIAMRRDTGALPSSGDGSDDRSILHLGDERRLTRVRNVIDETLLRSRRLVIRGA